MVENASSPTLLMRDVMRLVRDVVVAAAFGVPATVDTPLIAVTSRAVMARTESFLRSIIIFSANAPPCSNICNVQAANIFEIRHIEITKFGNMIFSDLDRSQNDIPTSRKLELSIKKN